VEARVSQASGVFEPGGTLLEVAVTLPLMAMYTYRDPRPDVRLPLGTQVVVPLGSRRVTGFVVGYAQEAPEGLKDIEAVLEEEPALEGEILELCRWIASYYAAPLGEVLRAALPQGERASASRRVRLSAEGRRLLEREAAGAATLTSLAWDAADRAVLQTLAKRGTVSLRLLQKERARVDRLVADGLVEFGDEVQGRSVERKVLVAFAVPGAAPQLSARAVTRAALWDRLRASPDGVAVASLETRERQALRLLVAAGCAKLEEVRALARSRAAAPPALNPHQALALEALVERLTGGYAPFVLQGITGSGKTEVYLRLISEARRGGRGALVLVPEIALTPQLAARFRARFGDDVAVLHSALPPGERRAAWRRLRAGEVGIALGARSAVFAPVRALGVVVVDEEHDGSFKQEDGVRYNARDVAIVRAQRAGAVVVLGSATPSLESFRNVELGRYRRLLLPVRANPSAATRPLPPVEVVDLRRQPPMADGLFSKPLLDAVERNLAAGEQTILFLNRRGFAPLVLCRACGFVLRCRDCAVSMTLHRGPGRLVCHYCASSGPLPALCPSCQLPRLEPVGVGTERVEGIVRALFPSARVARLDRDTAGSGRSGALERALGRVQAGEIDILVGTQMVTKGHDFAGVTLVGILLPDQGMHMPDFRATERTFQLLEQVSGRAGRAEKPGRVVLQTYCTEHPAIRSLRDHDYDGFARAELARRREAEYPPFTRMIALRIDGPEEARVREAAADVAARARVAAAGVRVMGPAEAPIPMLPALSRWQVWLVGKERAALAAVAKRAASAALPPDVRLAVDVDPQSVL
jgi:primosomal protein N' (replication factor Y) (superfamily II helicase)